MKYGMRSERLCGVWPLYPGRINAWSLARFMITIRHQRGIQLIHRSAWSKIKIMNYDCTYTATHKGWDFRDDCR